MMEVDAHFIELFLDSFQNVFSTLFQKEMTRKSMSVWNSWKTENDIAIVTGISGVNHTGMIVYCMKSETARQLVEILTPGCVDFDDLIYDGLGELVNIISGNSMTTFSQNHMDVTITTPSLIAGDQFTLHMLNQTTLSTELHSQMGSIEVKFAIKKMN
jgi:chemotaxis protein CheX